VQGLPAPPGRHQRKQNAPRRGQGKSCREENPRCGVARKTNSPFLLLLPQGTCKEKDRGDGKKLGEEIGVVERPVRAQITFCKPLVQGDRHLDKSDPPDRKERPVPRPLRIRTEKRNRPGEEDGGQCDVDRVLEGDPQIDGGKRVSQGEGYKSADQERVPRNACRFFSPSPEEQERSAKSRSPQDRKGGLERPPEAQHGHRKQKKKGGIAAASGTVHKRFITRR
jgi:hypothetical protein